jgi:hypothetical protein
VTLLAHYLKASKVLERCKEPKDEFVAHCGLLGDNRREKGLADGPYPEERKR